jgi:hypothetical protein
LPVALTFVPAPPEPPVNVMPLAAIVCSTAPDASMRAVFCVPSAPPVRLIAPALMVWAPTLAIMRA